MDWISGFAVLAALFIGFIQGLKKKKFKVTKQLRILEEENRKLKEEIKELEKRKRLNQYNHQAFSKHGVDKLEEELTAIITELPKQRLQVKHVLVCLSQIHEREKDRVVSTNGMGSIQEQIEYIKKKCKEDGIEYIHYQTKKELLAYDLQDVEKETIHFFDEKLKLNSYSVTYAEMIQAMENVLYMF